jgi:hypothetical protein
MPDVQVNIDNSEGPNLTNRVIWLALPSSLFDYSAFRPDGRDLQAYASDATTALATRLRTWKSPVGLRYLSRRHVPPGPPATPFLYGTGVAIAPLGLASGNQTVWGAGSDISGSGAVAGVLAAYDAAGNTLWTYSSPSSDYSMFGTIGDVDGDGVNEIAWGFRMLDHCVSLLNHDGTHRWSVSMPGSNNYCRFATIGKARNDLAGQQVLYGGELGYYGMVNKDGGALFAGQYTSPANVSVQAGLITDLTGSGQALVYLLHDNAIHQLGQTGTAGWTFTSTFTGGNTNKYYGVATGHIASTTNLALVAVTGSDTIPTGSIAAVDATGARIWERAYPVACYAVACTDIDGDGYDEVVVGWGSHYAEAAPAIGWGGISVFDRSGVELTAIGLGSSVKVLTVGDINNDGVNEVVASSDAGDLYILAFDTLGSTVKVTVPSIAAGSTSPIYLRSTGAATQPAAGDYDLGTTGADGSAASWATDRLGTWTIQANRLASPDEGETATGSAAEAAGVSCDSFELQFDAYKPGQGTGGSSDYYLGVFYRASSFSSGIPNGYRIQVGAKGHVNLDRMASGTPTQQNRLFTTVASGLLLNTTDRVTFRVGASGTVHTLAYSRNGGAWSVLYELQDLSGTAINSAGSIGLYNGRGQAQYANLLLNALPTSAVTVGLAGPGPIATPGTAIGTSGGKGRPRASGHALPFRGVRL